MNELVAELEFCSQVTALTGERERELQLHEGHVLLFGGRDVGLDDEDRSLARELKNLHATWHGKKKKKELLCTGSKEILKEGQEASLNGFLLAKSRAI